MASYLLKTDASIVLDHGVHNREYWLLVISCLRFGLDIQSFINNIVKG